MSIKIGGVTVIDDSRIIQNLGSALGISQGGTGGTTAAAARTSLGSTTVGDAVFTAASAAAARTALGLGSVAVDSIVPIVRGGTGGATISEALTNLGARSKASDSVTDVSTTTTMVAGNIYNVPSSATIAFQLNLPATPTVGQWVAVSIFCAANILTIGRNGSMLVGLAENLLVDTSSSTTPDFLTFYYTNSGWVMIKG